jgi:hypothetical protein
MNIKQFTYLVIMTFLGYILFLFYFKKENFEINSFSVVNHEDNSIAKNGLAFGKSDNYIVIGFESHEKNIAQIDSFICLKSYEIDLISKKYNNYHISIFKKSKITNNEHIQKFERDFVRYSVQNDLICTYSWSRGNFLQRYDPQYKYVLDKLICN